MGFKICGIKIFSISHLTTETSLTSSRSISSSYLQVTRWKMCSTKQFFFTLVCLNKPKTMSDFHRIRAINVLICGCLYNIQSFQKKRL